jgi:hypothetical protein
LRVRPIFLEQLSGVVSNNAGANPILFPSLLVDRRYTDEHYRQHCAFTLTSFASGPNGIGFAAVQADVLCASLLQPPGLLPRLLPGLTSVTGATTRTPDDDQQRSGIAPWQLALRRPPQ